MKNVNRAFWFVNLNLLVLIGLIVLSTSKFETSLSVAPIQRVGHAGTALGQYIYTNSLEALNAGYQKGFRTFEIDLLTLPDQEVVCLHDFQAFGKAPKLPEFLEARKTMPYTPCTLQELYDWINAHPDTYLMTDIKGQESFILTQVLERFAALKDRLIIQIYSMEPYESLRQQGVRNMIWTLYRIPPEQRSPQFVIESVKGRSLMAVTMPIKDAANGLAQKLSEAGFRVLTHTVNDCKQAQALFQEGVSEIYTDVLTPDTCALGTEVS